MERRKIDLEQGWVDIQQGLTKLKAIVEGSGDRFTSEEYMKLYTTIYNMCTTQERPPRDDYCQRLHVQNCQRLYEKYKKALEEYINDMVLPCIREKHDECMLMELVARWNKYKLMVRRLSRLFHYLDKNFIPRMSLSPLGEVGLTCFRDLVYEEVKGKATDAVNVLINKEREGEQINKELLKDVLNIYDQIGMGVMDRYEKDFGKHVLEGTGACYSCKASNWMLEDSCPGLKCDECLKKERDRASDFLHSSTGPKLIEILHTISIAASSGMERVKEQLLVSFRELLEGCRALPRDEKVGVVKLLDEQWAALACVMQEVGQELDRKTKDLDVEFRSKVEALEKREAEILHREERLVKREQALEKRVREAEEKDLEGSNLI